MSLDKAIKHKKEYRKEYYGSKAIDRQCRCGGSCEWCRENRLYKNKKRLQKMIDKEKEMWYNNKCRKELRKKMADKNLTFEQLSKQDQQAIKTLLNFKRRFKKHLQKTK